MYGQWRCYWPFGGGMFTDLFVHQVTHLLAAMGLQYPARVVGGGGIYLEYDERDVPDVATIVADFNEGCQVLISSTMCNDHRIEEVIRGHTGTVKFVAKESNLMKGFEVIPQKIAKTSTYCVEGEDEATAASTVAANQGEQTLSALNRPI